MPPLIERIRLLLNTKDLLRIQCGTRDLKKIYGVLAYNKAILELAQGKFYIPHKKPNEEINQELIRYYLCKS